MVCRSAARLPAGRGQHPVRLCREHGDDPLRDDDAAEAAPPARAGADQLQPQAPGRRHAPPEYREERDGAAARTVAAWNADDVQFRYVDDAGEERQDWPPSRAEPETLPRLVKLVVKHAGGGETVWLIAPGADPWLPPKPRGNPFGVELPG